MHSKEEIDGLKRKDEENKQQFEISQENKRLRYVLAVGFACFVLFCFCFADVFIYYFIAVDFVVVVHLC